jgi:hypothetical protein
MSTTPASPRPLVSGPPVPQTGQTGWALFAGILLGLNGFFGVMYGLAAILNDEVVTVGGKGVTIWDFTAWGWITLAIGVAMALTGAGLLLGVGVARWLGVGFAFLHALAQFGTISAFPLWSVLVVAIDVIIIYQLITHWQPDS